jgi:hypothetical protein
MSAAAKDAMRAQMGEFKKAAACLLLLRIPRPPCVFVFCAPLPFKNVSSSSTRPPPYLTSVLACVRRRSDGILPVRHAPF